jgi:hypothetical protein
MNFFRFLMWPSNFACDLLHLEDEHERGMLRMLVNTLVWTTLGVVVFTVVWMATN